MASVYFLAFIFTIPFHLFFPEGDFQYSENPINHVNSDISDCTFNGFSLHGKVKIVESFPDMKIQVVSDFPDLNVKFVSNFPDDCGEWQIVESFPDFTIQFVESFPDVKIKIVDSFPGLP